MSKEEARRVEVIRQNREGIFTNRQAAQLLGLSVRSIQRLKRKADADGDMAVLHGNRGKQPHNSLPDNMRNQVLAYAKKELAGYNFSHMRDVMEKELELKISRSTLSRLLHKEAVYSPRKHRPQKIHRSRPRRAHMGELVQLDASMFDWFSDGNNYHLHGAIDDATGDILGLFFTKEETFEAYCELMFQMNEQYGLPKELYTDGRTIFKYESAKKKKTSLADELAGIRETMPQFARACSSLNIPINVTHVPQAKGRIERLWNTLQDRLPKDLKREGITSISDAHRFLKGFIKSYNKQFAVAPREETSAFSNKRPPTEVYIAFARHENRTLDNGLTFSYNNQRYALPEEFRHEKVPSRPKDVVTVIDSHRIGLKVLTHEVCLTPHKASEPRPKSTPIKRSEQELSAIRSENSRKNKHKSPWAKQSIASKHKTTQNHSTT